MEEGSRVQINITNYVRGEGTCSLSRDIFASFPILMFFPPPPPQIQMTSILWSNPDFTRLSKTTNVNKKFAGGGGGGGGKRLQFLPTLKLRRTILTLPL